MQISGVVITFNEEKNIFRCLSSLKDVADEIIVLDSFSNDKTLEIIRNSFKDVKIYQNTFKDYSSQKNLANSKASYDFILSIDADEALSNELKQSIIEIKDKDFNDNTLFSFNRKTNYCGTWVNHCGWYPDKKIRIFNRNFASWQGDIHETLSYNNTPNIIHLKGDLFHYSYYTVQEHINQINKFTTLTSREAYNKGKKSSFMKMYLAFHWKFLRDFIFHLGFMDKKGYQICKLSAFATMIKYIKLQEHNKDKK
jgi:glycosyltransferase involved in cell wall biosynthesis